MATGSINGVRLHYEVRGAGPTIVWGHGLMGSIAQGELLNEGVAGLEARGFRVVTYDARGHGESGYTDAPADYAWQSLAEDLKCLLDTLEIERAHIGGGSMGAGIAITLALAHPERIERLVLVAPPPLRGEIGPARQLFGAFASLIESAGLEQAVEVAMQLPDFAVLKETQPGRYRMTRAWLLSLNPQATVIAIRGLLEGPQLPEERFGEIAAPTLIVTHPDDPIHPQTTGETLHTAITGSRLVTAPERTYYQERRDELMDTVSAFLSGEA